MPEPALRLAAFILCTALFFGCWQRSTTGPGEIHWDRQTCERCQMVISERRHAVQTRTPGHHTAHAFDDLGCALLWVDEQGLAESDPPQEVWVRDAKDSQWISASSAQFESGFPTPMAYGFATTDHGVALEAVREQIRTAELGRRSPSTHDGHQGHGGSQSE